MNKYELLKTGFYLKLEGLSRLEHRTAYGIMLDGSNTDGDIEALDFGTAYDYLGVTQKGDVEYWEATGKYGDDAVELTLPQLQEIFSDKGGDVVAEDDEGLAFTVVEALLRPDNISYQKRRKIAKEVSEILKDVEMGRYIHPDKVQLNLQVVTDSSEKVEEVESTLPPVTDTPEQVVEVKTKPSTEFTKEALLETGFYINIDSWGEEQHRYLYDNLKRFSNGSSDERFQLGDYNNLGIDYERDIIYWDDAMEYGDNAVEISYQEFLDIFVGDKQVEEVEPLIPPQRTTSG